MTDTAARRAIELLIEQARSARDRSRFAAAVATAARSVEAAEQYGDPGLHIAALQVEADTLRMCGDNVAALARYTRILGMAEDPTVTAHLDDSTLQAVARSYLGWVNMARLVGGIPVPELFRVLDAAEQWFTAIGHRDWRAGILLQRALIHRRLREYDKGIAAAQEALVRHRPGAPGYTIAGHLFQLGELLQLADRLDEAEENFRAILDHPDSTPYDHKGAWQGLARCALARNDPQRALEHARTAVEAAEPLGDDPLISALDILVEAQRAVGDLDAAWHTATRCLRIARGLGSTYRLYFAVRDVVDVGIDRGEPSVEALLDELERLAATLDGGAAGILTDEAAWRRSRHRAARDEG